MSTKLLHEVSFKLCKENLKHYFCVVEDYMFVYDAGGGPMRLVIIDLGRLL